MKLWILRHARAQDYSDSGRDQDRALSERGLTACHHLNRWLRTSPYPLPNRAHVSPALRTQQTAQHAFQDLPIRCLDDDSLWLASSRALRRRVEQAQATPSLCLVGHNPGLEELIIALGCPLPVPGLKPGTLAIIDLPGSGSAQLLEVIPPREST